MAAALCGLAAVVCSYVIPVALAHGSYSDRLGMALVEEGDRLASRMAGQPDRFSLRFESWRLWPSLAFSLGAAAVGLGALGLFTGANRFWAGVTATLGILVGLGQLLS